MDDVANFKTAISKVLQALQKSSGVGIGIEWPINWTLREIVERRLGKLEEETVEYMTEGNNQIDKNMQAKR